MAFKASNPGIFFATLLEKTIRWQGTSSDDAEPEELAEEYSSLTDLTDEQMLEKANVAVQFEIGVKHTVMYDVYNLCEMAFENKLSFLKVKMLKEMCKHFEIPSNIKRHQIKFD